MASSKRIRVLIVMVIMALPTGCGLTTHAPDKNYRLGALQRWNHCLTRYSNNLEHYCDGHRRDVIATFPPHERYQINTLLMQKIRLVSNSRAMKTALEKDTATN